MDKFTRFHTGDDTELLREAQEILRALDRTKVKNVSASWIERCQWVATNKGKGYPGS
jgi:hypothetical protein